MTQQDLSIPVIAIDGEAVSGKGTARAGIATALGFHELDSGVLYRAVGLLCMRKKVPLTDEKQCAAQAEALKVVMKGGDIFIGGHKETGPIRSLKCGTLASVVSQFPQVRDQLRKFQLSMRKAPGLVADGRDQCTLFETPHRFFFTADAEVRARRVMEYCQKTKRPADFAEILSEILRRDKTDKQRHLAPLKPHPEATIIDTSRMTIQDMVDAVLSAYHRKCRELQPS